MYCSEENTWEPEDHMDNCEEKIKAFAMTSKFPPPEIDENNNETVNEKENQEVEEEAVPKKRRVVKVGGHWSDRMPRHCTSEEGCLWHYTRLLWPCIFYLVTHQSHMNKNKSVTNIYIDR